MSAPPQRPNAPPSTQYYLDANGVPTPVTQATPLPTSSSTGPAATVADGADVALGATTDAAVTTQTTGTLLGYLRALKEAFLARIPSALGGHGGLVVEGVASGTPVPVVDAFTPGANINYRTAVTPADGTTKPSASSTLFALNPGSKQWCRVFVTSSGSPAASTMRPYIRAGGSAGQVAPLDLQTLNGTPNYDGGFDIRADGDDVAVLIETLSGGTITLVITWR